MSVARHTGPEIFLFLLLLLLLFIYLFNLFLLPCLFCVELQRLLHLMLFISIDFPPSLSYCMPVAASEMTKEVDADMLSSFPFPHTPSC